MKACPELPCQQRIYDRQERCVYHQKVRDGLLRRASDEFSAVELETLFEGRLHQDGRRLDHWVVADEEP